MRERAAEKSFTSYTEKLLIIDECGSVSFKIRKPMRKFKVKNPYCSI